MVHAAMMKHAPWMTLVSLHAHVSKLHFSSEFTLSFDINFNLNYQFKEIDKCATNNGACGDDELCEMNMSGIVTCTRK